MTDATAVIVGAGVMGRAWAQNVAECPGVRQVGWVDLDPRVVEAAAAELSVFGVLITDDLGKAIAETEPDFVIDVTVPGAHRAVTLQALAAGVPVLGEKPMAESMADARAMVQASEKAGKLYMVSQSRRYDARLNAFRRLIDERLGGRPEILDSGFYLGPHFAGFRNRMPSPLLADMAIHTFDAARYLTGADPVSVYCEEFNPSWSWYTGAACAFAVFEMTGGLRYTYRGSWCAEGRPTSWEAEWRAVGPQGTAAWDGDGAPVATVALDAPVAGLLRPWSSHTAEITPIYPSIAGSLREFLRALQTGESPMGECHDNIKSLSMVLAAVESARSGARVRVADL